jgi:ABC-type xylose transport system substrate-binding protein
VTFSHGAVIISAILADLASVGIVITSIFTIIVFMKTRKIETQATEIHSTIVNNHQEDVDQREGNNGTNPAKGS